MFGGFINWLNRKLEPKSLVTQTPEEAYRLLKERNSAEIAARLLVRAVHYELSGRDWLRRAGALDRVAAEQIERLIGLANPDKDITPWIKLRNGCMDQLLAEMKTPPENKDTVS